MHLLLQLLLLIELSASSAQLPVAQICSDSGLTAFDSLLAPSSGVLHLNFNQLPTTLYGPNSTANWLLLLYSPFGGYSVEYAAHFASFASKIAVWRGTIKLAAMDASRPENLAALRRYQLTGLPSLLFIARQTPWLAAAPSRRRAGAARELPMPRDPDYLEDELFAQLEKRVPKLRPVKSVHRVLRVPGATELFYLEEPSDSLLSRRAILSCLEAAATTAGRKLFSKTRIVWRINANVASGRVRLSRYRRPRGRPRGPFRRDINLLQVNSSSELAALIRCAQPHRDRHRVAAATPCELDAAAEPPTPGQLIADARQYLRRDIAACLAANEEADVFSSTAATAAALLDFLRLLRNVLPSLTGQVVVLARHLLHRHQQQRPASAKVWLRLLANGEPEPSDAGDDVDWRWRLLLSLSVARLRAEEGLPSVLATARRLQAACSTSLTSLTLLAAAPEWSAATPADELLLLWRLHSLSRGRVFPPPSLCPGCRLTLDMDIDGDKDDVLRFLVGWYGPALGSERMTSVDRRRSALPRLPELPTNDSGDGGYDEEVPCLLKLLRWLKGSGGGDWARLALLLAAGCASGATLLCWLGGSCDRR
ncbi:hypothetical protein BOX15_Mlig032762g1 [Macrostomum lignano]|uniref:Thioredoxin domain-containing protein n=1 Tax=Macrostomum lignano TaxID=282301 RepID=A0A267GBU3_9PLAT|nr:hypothetical protein BOX15_Mlig032762g1 [Macrostomum lignano]